MLEFACIRQKKSNEAQSTKLTRWHKKKPKRSKLVALASTSPGQKTISVQCSEMPQKNMHYGTTSLKLVTKQWKRTWQR